MKEISQVFFDSSIRPEQIIHLGTQCVLDPWPDAVLDALSDYEEAWEAMRLKDPDLDEPDEIAAYLRRNGKAGFLVQFATPVPNNMTKTSFLFSWGHYTTKWIYAGTYEAACKKAIEWREAYIAKKRAAA